MNLIIDIGNSLSKITIFNHDKIVNSYTTKTILKDRLINILFKHPKINKAIISSVKKENKEIINFLNKNLSCLINLDYRTKVPVSIKYKSIKTLGKDRIAGICGANNIYKKTNVIVFDLGTALTIDFLNSENEYLGGNISPGMQIRFKALNEYTDLLPLLTKSNEYKLIGDDTSMAIISGVQNGLIFEIEKYIETAECSFDNLKIIMTGGDSDFFVKKIKKTIFAEPNLVQIGLNAILKYNV